LKELAGGDLLGGPSVLDFPSIERCQQTTPRCDSDRLRSVTGTHPRKQRGQLSLDITFAHSQLGGDTRGCVALCEQLQGYSFSRRDLKYHDASFYFYVERQALRSTHSSY
jgi:hypothetical protein